MSLQTRLTALAQAVGADIKALNSTLTTLSTPVTQKRQAAGTAAQSGPSNGTYWVYNTAGAPYLDLTPGTWRIEGAVLMYGNVADYVALGLYDETLGAGVNGSAGAAVVVQPLVNPGGYGNPSTVHTLTITSNKRYRLWVIPNGASTQTIVASAAVPIAFMEATKLNIGVVGPKGDQGGTMLDASAIGGAQYANIAAGWNQLPLDAGAVISANGGTPDFTRNASGSITFNKAGTYDISATMGNATAAQPSTATMDCRLIVGAVGVVNPDTTVNALAAERRQAAINDYNICSLSGSVTVVAGQSLAAWMFCSVAVNGVGVSHFSITKQGGPQGAKGDPGSVSVVKTLNWNTAILPNFYRSTNDGLERTLNGPGDTLNPPPQAGIVSVHESGALVQRVWDLSYQKSYTRFLLGGSWTAWVADVTKTPIVTDQMIGGATPEEGDERIFQNAAMKTLGIAWRFRYDNTAPAGKPKWVFVGGSPYRLSTSAAVAGYSTGNGAYVYGAAMATPKFTLPLSGDYTVEFKMNCQGGAVGDLRAAAFCNNALVPDIESFGFVGSGAINDNFSGDSTILSAVGGQVVDLRMLASVANATTNVYTRSITITPIRLTL